MSELEVGVLGLFEGGRPFLPVIIVLERRDVAFKRADLLTVFNAPGFTTFRCRLTVVVLDDLRELLAARLITAGRSRFEIVKAVDRLEARSSREAFCLECSAASISARSRAASIAAFMFFVFTATDFPG